MKRMTKAIIAIAAGIAALAAVSCSKDETIRYNNVTMGNNVNGRFTSDQGNIFNVAEQTCIGKLDTMKRALVICDVLSLVEGTENEYDIRLNYLAPVLTKDAVFSSAITEGNELKDCPIVLQSYWLSGGYINIYLIIPVIKDSKTKHYINLVYDDTKQSEGTYSFQIFHDDSGENIKENKDKEIVLSYGYVSVPVSSIIKEDNAKIILSWNNYKVWGSSIDLSKTETYSREMQYSKDSYQQVPQEAQASRSSFIELR